MTDSTEDKQTEEPRARSVQGVERVVITRLPAKSGHDSRDVKANGLFIGFSPLDSDFINLQRCFKCRKENYYSAVAAGTCAWCGWKANEVEL